jgi:hypothetical protein
MTPWMGGPSAFPCHYPPEGRTANMSLVTCHSARRAPWRILTLTGGGAGGWRKAGAGWWRFPRFAMLTGPDGSARTSGEVKLYPYKGTCCHEPI